MFFCDENMKANLVCFTAIFVLACFISVAGADVDCSKIPYHVPLHMCCQPPDLNKNEKILEECAEFAGPPMPPPPMTRDNNMPPPPPMPPHGHQPLPPHPYAHPAPCLAECIFNKTEILDENGSLNPDKFDDLIAEISPDDEELAAVARESFNTCAEKCSEIKDGIKEEMSKHMANRGMHPMCSPFATMMWQCMRMEIYRNCPASIWNDSEECNASRDFLIECEEKKSE